MIKTANSQRFELETDFFRKHNNRFVSRERRFRSVQLRSFHVFLILAVVAVLLFFAQRLAAFVLSWDRLALRAVRINQAPERERSEMWTIINQHRGNILAMNLGAMKQKLLGLHQVRDVSLSRDLPSTLDIRFTLRNPLVRWRFGTTWRVYDEVGVFLYATEAASDSLLPVIDTDFARAEKVFARIGELRKLSGVLDHVSYGIPHGFEVKLKGVAEVLYPGDGDMNRKISEYLRIRCELTAEEMPLYVDMRIPDRFYLGYPEKKEESDEK